MTIKLRRVTCTCRCLDCLDGKHSGCMYGCRG